MIYHNTHQLLLLIKVWNSSAHFSLGTVCGCQQWHSRLCGLTPPSRQAGLHAPGATLASAAPSVPPPYGAGDFSRRPGPARQLPAGPTGRPASHPRGLRGPQRPRPAPPPVQVWCRGRGLEAHCCRRGRSLRGDATALAVDPGSLECAFVQWGRQCQRRRVTSARSVRSGRRRWRTRIRGSAPTSRARSAVLHKAAGSSGTARTPAAQGRLVLGKRGGRGWEEVLVFARGTALPPPSGRAPPNGVWTQFQAWEQSDFSVSKT